MDQLTVHGPETRHSTDKEDLLLISQNFSDTFGGEGSFTKQSVQRGCSHWFKEICHIRLVWWGGSSFGVFMRRGSDLSTYDHHYINCLRCSLTALRKNPPCVVWASGGCWQSLDLLGVQMAHPNLCFCLHMTFFLPACVSSCKDTSHIASRAHPNPVWPNLQYLLLQAPNFQIRPYSEVPGRYSFWRDTSQCSIYREIYPSS